MADEPLVPTQEDRDADELYNIVYHHCVTKYDPEAGKRVAASYLARHAHSARLQGREEAARVADAFPDKNGGAHMISMSIAAAIRAGQ